MTAKAKNKHAKGGETDETFRWGIRFWELQATNAALSREMMMYLEMSCNVNYR